MLATLARAMRAAYRIANTGPRWAPQLTMANVVTAGFVLATIWALTTGRIPKDGLHHELSPLAQSLVAVGVIVSFVGFIIAEAITTVRRTRRAYQLFMLPGMAEQVSEDPPFRRWVIDNAMQFDPATTGALELAIAYQLARHHQWRQAQRRVNWVVGLVPFNLARRCRV